MLRSQWEQRLELLQKCAVYRARISPASLPGSGVNRNVESFELLTQDVQWAAGSSAAGSPPSSSGISTGAIAGIAAGVAAAVIIGLALLLCFTRKGLYVRSRYICCCCPCLRTSRPGPSNVLGFKDGGAPGLRGGSQAGECRML